MPVSEYQHIGFVECRGEKGEVVRVHEFRAVSVSPAGERRFRTDRRYRLERGETVKQDDPETFRVEANGYRLTIRWGAASGSGDLRAG